jgi:hypothetical protein
MCIYENKASVGLVGKVLTPRMHTDPTVLPITTFI